MTQAEEFRERVVEAALATANKNGLDMAFALNARLRGLAIPVSSVRHDGTVDLVRITFNDGSTSFFSPEGAHAAATAKKNIEGVSP